MTLAYDYELFVRTAFGTAAGKPIGRFEDPAELADTDTFTAGNLDAVKVAVGYAMGIITKHIRNKDAATHDAMDAYISRVVAAGSVDEIHGIIKDFDKNVTDKYFDRVEGLLQPK